MTLVALPARVPLTRHSNFEMMLPGAELLDPSSVTDTVSPRRVPSESCDPLAATVVSDLIVNAARGGSVAGVPGVPGFPEPFVAPGVVGAPSWLAPEHALATATSTSAENRGSRQLRRVHAMRLAVPLAAGAGEASGAGGKWGGNRTSRGGARAPSAGLQLTSLQSELRESERADDDPLFIGLGYRTSAERTAGSSADLGLVTALPPIQNTL